ncbi:hypothetical protein C8A01DRAFT_14012 [Parachaetomium inaequale]|uniref:Uncharacterized protein n=1 Tax=Parachaetomium inaequale TaxID=2588326 RepID=A0AAN6PK30_9PEZI|nr:hypothetical protein C8A01DRAFT_14012 [Parachaetomium inaequale]
MAGSVTTSAISPGISPGMAYRPLNFPSLYGSDTDDERRWTLSFNLATVFRVLVTVAALADIITWSRMGPIHSTVLVVFVELFIVLGWNVVLLLPQSRVTRVLPAVVCQIGDCDCVFNSDDDEEGWPRKPKNKQQKRWKLLFTALVDLVLGLTTTIIMSDGLELILAVISLVACFWTLDLELGVHLRHIDEPETHIRIQLAPDTDDRRTAGGTVSVAA